MKIAKQKTGNSKKAEEVNEKFPVNCGSLTLVISRCFQTNILLIKNLWSGKSHTVCVGVITKIQERQGFFQISMLFSIQREILISVVYPS